MRGFENVAKSAASRLAEIVSRGKRCVIYEVKTKRVGPCQDKYTFKRGKNG